MEGKILYSIREDCSKLQEMSHININRILELMTQHHKISVKLKNYAKCCMVMEKLCDYICNCCCNADFVSDFSIAELLDKCLKMKNCCLELNNLLSKEKSEYIRCIKMISLCDKIKKTTKLDKPKKEKTKKKSKKRVEK